MAVIKVEKYNNQVAAEFANGILSQMFRIADDKYDF